MASSVDGEHRPSPEQLCLLFLAALAFLPSVAISAWDNFPQKSIRVAEAEASDGAVDFYALVDTEGCMGALEDPHPVHGFQATDGSYIFSGKGIDRGGTREGFVVKIWPSGECIWGWTSGLEGKEDVVNAAVQLPGGGSVLAVGFRDVDGVYSRTITMIDLSTGDEVWTASTFGDGPGSYGAFENAEFEVGLGNPALLLGGLRAKADKEELDFKSYGNTPGGRAVVMKLPMSAVAGYLPPTAEDVAWTVTDLAIPGLEGDEQQSLGTCKAVVSMPGGEEYAALFFTDGAEDAMTALALLNTDGSIRWGPVKLGSYGEGTDISATPDGRFIYVSSLGSPDISGRLTKVSAINGDVLWSKFYRFPCRVVLSLPHPHPHRPPQTHHPHLPHSRLPHHPLNPHHFHLCPSPNLDPILSRSQDLGFSFQRFRLFRVFRVLGLRS